MTTLTQEKAFLQAGTLDLEQYLLSNELFWPLMGDMQRLSPGSLMLGLKRAKALAESPADQSALEQYTAKFNAVRSHWAAAWEEKAAREFSMRFKLWSEYVNDYRGDPGHNAGIYINEVRQRTILALLAQDMSARMPEMYALAELDHVIRAQVVTGECIWGAIFEPVFPRDLFWFLYRSLHK
jgi:hypothetical protein